MDMELHDSVRHAGDMVRQQTEGQETSECDPTNDGVDLEGCAYDNTEPVARRVRIIGMQSLSAVGRRTGQQVKFVQISVDQSVVDQSVVDQSVDGMRRTTLSERRRHRGWLLCSATVSLVVGMALVWRSANPNPRGFSSLQAASTMQPRRGSATRP